MNGSEEWSLGSLRASLMRAISDQDKRWSDLAGAQDKAIQAALVAQDKAVQAALVAQEKAVQAALAASNKAVDKAEAAAREWQQSANEWRGAMSDREYSFVSRRELWGYILGAVGLVTGIITVLDRSR